MKTTISHIMESSWKNTLTFEDRGEISTPLDYKEYKFYIHG